MVRRSRRESLVSEEWATVVVVAEVDEYELVSGLLWAAGVAGIEEIEQPDGRIELRAGCRAEVVEDVRRSLTERWSLDVERTEGDAGLDEWREHAVAWRAGERFVVVPAWQPPPEWITGADIVLVVDPDRSFGSGSHPTTRSCLVAVERRVRPGMVVADVGCGSGVLAIAAARRGASAVHAVDTDPRAVTATEANAQRNGVGARVRAMVGSVEQLDAGRHDVVLANIGAATLCELAPALCALVTTEGVLVLSGVLDTQTAAVIDAHGAFGFVPAQLERDGEWCTIELRRGDGSD
jgi:ribosomal protein L11 methyltransferase